MHKTAIIHFLPLEIFPPTLNLIELIPEEFSSNTQIFSLTNHKGRSTANVTRLKSVRFPSPSEKGIGKFKKLFRHFFFNYHVLYSLIKLAPKKILYYESFSAFPVFLYAFFFNKKVQILIHCHEYYSPDWYTSQTIQLKLCYFLERNFLFKKAKWISQTNEKRRLLFSQDFPNLNPDKIKVVPNYPPKRWLLNTNNHNTPQKIVRFVYIGTLSINYTFIKEFCEWIKVNRNASLDIYSYNLDADALSYLQSNQRKNIKFHNEGIEYDQIPMVLNNYDIGLILYKALTLNFKYNATNKLFEYLACDLDVWFPQEMIGCYEYITTDTYPQVKKIDFSNLNRIQPDDMKRGSLNYKPLHYWCEDAFQPLIKELFAE